MGTYKWADIASSESCASFGRTTVMLLERRERYNGLHKNLTENKGAAKSDRLHGNSKSAHFMLMANDSYVDKNSIPELHDSKLNLNAKLKNVQLKPLSNEDKALLDDDEMLSPLLTYNEENVDDKNPKSFANFLTPENEGKLRQKPAANLKNQRGKQSARNHCPKGEPPLVMERLSPTSASSSGKEAKKEEAPPKSPDPSPKEQASTPEVNEKRGNNSQTTNYYDEDTNKPLNPKKRFKNGMKMTATEREEISNVLLTEIKKKTTPRVVEDNNTRVYSRLKDIAIGKATKGYQNYIRMVPKDERGPDDPQTPNSKNVSASKFRAMYRTWRTQLHKYDNVK